MYQPWTFVSQKYHMGFLKNMRPVSWSTMSQHFQIGTVFKPLFHWNVQGPNFQEQKTLTWGFFNISENLGPKGHTLRWQHNQIWAKTKFIICNSVNSLLAKKPYFGSVWYFWKFEPHRLRSSPVIGKMQFLSPNSFQIGEWMNFSWQLNWLFGSCLTIYLKI